MERKRRVELVGKWEREGLNQTQQVGKIEYENIPTNHPSVEKEQDNELYKKDANAVC